MKIEKCTAQEYEAHWINSIKNNYAPLRQKSKGITFALQYMGTWRTLVQNFDLPKKEAVHIEKSYHDLYTKSDEWIQAQIKKAAKQGYAELAFGLHLHTPLLPKVILGNHRTLPYEAHKEIKTVGNAVTQSYGLLNTRAANEFMSRVWKSKWRYKILPIAQIHDSIYLIIENSMECLQWTNKHLIDCMEWNQLPEIQHPQVGLEAELEVFFPTWNNPIRIPNNASKATILKCVNDLQKQK